VAQNRRLLYEVQKTGLQATDITCRVVTSLSQIRSVTVHATVFHPPRLPGDHMAPTSVTAVTGPWPSCLYRHSHGRVPNGSVGRAEHMPRATLVVPAYPHTPRHGSTRALTKVEVQSAQYETKRNETERNETIQHRTCHERIICHSLSHFMSISDHQCRCTQARCPIVDTRFRGAFSLVLSLQKSMLQSFGCMHIGLGLCSLPHTTAQVHVQVWHWFGVSDLA